ncbi:hypothetical protein DHD05_18195 [Arenibacter sp. N53]|nr:hypothetical protein [Arenibacter sp. N53]
MLWFPCLPGISHWDARSESLYRMKTKNQQALACYGFHACPGFPFGMHAVNPFKGMNPISIGYSIFFNFSNINLFD